MMPAVLDLPANQSLRRERISAHFQSAHSFQLPLAVFAPASPHRHMRPSTSLLAKAPMQLYRSLIILVAFMALSYGETARVTFATEPTDKAKIRHLIEESIRNLGANMRSIEISNINSTVDGRPVSVYEYTVVFHGEIRIDSLKASLAEKILQPHEVFMK